MTPREWTIVLRAGQSGELSYVPVEGDIVEWDDEKKRLNVIDIRALADITSQLVAFEDSEPVTDEKFKLEFMRLLRSAGAVNGASFRLESVVGYFRGKRT